MKKIVLISALSYQSGKDTFAQFVAEEAMKNNLRCRIFSFGAWVKDAAARLYNFNGTKDENGRHLLQYFATDVVRAKFPDYWAEVTAQLMKATEDEYDLLIIPDFRFPNEYTVMTRYFPLKDIITVRIDRDIQTENADPNRAHFSEHALEQAHFGYDCIINNNNSLDHLHFAAEKFYQLLMT